MITIIDIETYANIYCVIMYIQVSNKGTTSAQLFLLYILT